MKEIQLKESLPLAVESFFKDLITENFEDYSEIKEKLNLLEIYMERTFFSCVVMQFATNIDYDAKLIRSMTKPLKEYLELNSLGYVYGDSNKGQFVVLLNYNLPSESETPLHYLVKIVKDIEAFSNKVIAEASKVKIHIGVGNYFNDVFSFSASYRQAIKCLNKRFFQEDKSTFFFWEDKDVDLNAVITYPYEKESTLLNCILNGDIDGSLEALYKFFEELEMNLLQSDALRYKSRFKQLLYSLDLKLNENKIPLNEIVGSSPDITEIIDSIEGLSNIKETFVTLINKIVNYIINQEGLAKSSSYHAIQKAIKYINEHHNEKITLNAVADLVFLAPTYFSAQFKKETDKNFIDYLKETRILKAKQLLKATDLKIYEISLSVGYQNPKYFTDTFKDFTGMSPLEYRQKVINR